MHNSDLGPPTIGYAIIHKPHLSNREGIISFCRHFDWLHFPVLAQSDVAKIAVVAAHVRCRWRSTDRDGEQWTVAASLK